MHQDLRRPIAARKFVDAMGRAATGVSVVTTEGSAGRVGLTVSAVTSVSAEPPLLLICVNRKSPAAAAISENRIFAVNLLAAHNQDYAETFAGRSAAKAYDFSVHDWELGATGAPLVREASAIFECELESSHDAGSHRIFIGRVVDARSGSAEPLLYCNRAFRRIATH